MLTNAVAGTRVTVVCWSVFPLFHSFFFIELFEVSGYKLCLLCFNTTSGLYGAMLSQLERTDVCFGGDDFVVVSFINGCQMSCGM